MMNNFNIVIIVKWKDLMYRLFRPLNIQKILIYKNYFFLLGKRRCPAEAFAKNVLFLLFVSIIQKYCLLPVPGEKSVKIEFISGLIITPKPYEMLILPR